MENLRFSHNGWVVHLPDPKKDPLYHERGASDVDKASFQGRRPVMADDRIRHIHVGEPGWYHHDVVEHHGLGYDAYESNHQGYFDGGPDWGNGKLKWYNYGPDDVDHNDIAESLREAGFDIQDSPDKLENGLAEDPAPDIDWDDDDILASH
jgi:hypothetical protein